MRRPRTLLACARPATLFLTGVVAFMVVAHAPVLAQGAPQTVTLMKVDPQSLATGYRASKVIGSSVLNESGTTVGTIDDLIVTPNERVPYVVLSVGGFLGLGTKYVVEPFNALEMTDKKIVLRGATKDSLRGLPEFKYNTQE